MMRPSYLKAVVILSFLVIISITACDTKKISDSQQFDASYISERGEQTVEVSAKTLVSTLINAIEEQGIEGAIHHCNLRALHFSDSLSAKNEAIIRRTSTRFRNPQNRPTQLEEKILVQYQQLLENEQPIVPIVQVQNGDTFYFSPIRMQAMCSNCHGMEHEITALKTIKEFYPQDLATGFNIGDLRGMWSIKLLSADIK